MTQNPKYSVVVPCYNSFQMLESLASRVHASMEQAGAASDFELILVNDASPNNETWKTIARLSDEYNWIKGVDLQFNVGQFRALMAGFDQVRGELVITMDDDLQHPPEEIPKFIQAMEDDPEMDAIIGAYQSKQHSFYRNLGRTLVNKISEVLYKKPKDFESTSFRIMKRSLVESLVQHRTMKPIMGALILKNTRHLKNIPVEHHPREQGQSGYSFSKLVSSTFDNVIDSSTAPLRFFGGTGILISMASVLIALFYLASWLLGFSKAPGFITLVLLITFFGGATLFGIGLVGEYLARVVQEVSRSPLYVVREIRHSGDDEQ